MRNDERVDRWSRLGYTALPAITSQMGSKATLDTPLAISGACIPPNSTTLCIGILFSPLL
jgi:hypothetical protein